MRANPLMPVAGWEAFMHGVFAIAVTLLVLDIRVPDSAEIDSGSALIDALAEELPRYVAYIVGFLFVGTYWLQTHRLMSWMRGIDHWAIVLGLVYLMVISAVPFVTALLAEYIGLDDGRDQVALVVFASWQLVLAILAVAVVRYGMHGGRLLKPTITEASLRPYLRAASLGPVLWVVALLAALFVGAAATLLLTAVGLAIFLLVEIPVPVAEDVEASGS
jgi:uncharacterized membrane protein